MDEGEATKSAKIIQIDEGVVHKHLAKMVRGSVEETLNALLETEAEASTP